jgi:hypothetical protein
MTQEQKGEILETYKWIKIKRYVDDESLSCEVRYLRLLEHHTKETEFLINKIREIVSGL